MIYKLNNDYFVRTLELGDVDGDYPNWFQDQSVCEFNSHGKFFHTIEWYKDSLKKLNNGNNVTWAICHVEKGHVGNISLQSLSFINRTAEFAIIIGNQEHSQAGLGKMASLKLFEHGFYKLNIERIYCGTADNNLKMKSLAKSLGMKEEGRRRKHLFLNNERVDVVEYGILKEEFNMEIIK